MVELQNRAHFVGIASRLMRQILVDYTRKRRARKRDGGCRIDLEALADLPIQGDARLLALDEALESLSRQDERKAKVVDRAEQAREEPFLPRRNVEVTHLRAFKPRVIVAPLTADLRCHAVEALVLCSECRLLATFVGAARFA
jgi:hypothetical protein